MNIMAPILTLGALGALFGALLAVGSKIFATQRDPRLAEVLGSLPGANCGGCGHPGCAQLAEAIVAGAAPTDACPVGGPQTARQVAYIMGVEAAPATTYVAHVGCRGGDNATKKYRYTGIRDCVNAAKVAGGPLDCPFGCLGLGSCVKVCDYDAIHIEKGVAVVHAEHCKACGKCVSVCPRGLISVVSHRQDVFVSCSSQLKGGQLRTLCNIGCIGCMLCTKACPTGAIRVDNNLARIDYEKCDNCGKCVPVCPRKLIVNASESVAQAVRSRRLEAD